MLNRYNTRVWTWDCRLSVLSICLATVQQQFVVLHFVCRNCNAVFYSLFLRHSFFLFSRVGAARGIEQRRENKCVYYSFTRMHFTPYINGFHSWSLRWPHHKQFVWIYLYSVSFLYSYTPIMTYVCTVIPNIDDTR